MTHCGHSASLPRCDGGAVQPTRSYDTGFFMVDPIAWRSRIYDLLLLIDGDALRCAARRGNRQRLAVLG
jgi:hypothetical protein